MKDCVSNLELTSTEDLLTELIGRFDQYVFMGLRVCEKKGNTFTVDWCGEEFTCKGLALSVIEKIKEDSELMNYVEEQEEEE